MIDSDAISIDFIIENSIERIIKLAKIYNHIPNDRVAEIAMRSIVEISFMLKDLTIIESYEFNYNGEDGLETIYLYGKFVYIITKQQDNEFTIKKIARRNIK